MADVAALAGVSHQTVSRVLNDNPRVAPDTRRRVEEAIRKLNYQPNSVARALVTGRSRTLGVVSFDTALYGPASTLIGIQDAAHQAGYHVATVSLRSLVRSSILDAIERLRRQSVEGVIIIAPELSAAQALVNLPADLPVVAVEGALEVPVPVVAVDQQSGGLQATQHLLDLGHPLVWHISGPVDWAEARGRERGWRMALEEAGVAAPPALVGDWSARSGFLLGQRLAAVPGLSAVFAGNDQMALGLLRALREAGRDVPGDVSVVGFDDIPESAYFTPPLTTVRQDFAEVGRRSLTRLLEQIDGAPRVAGTDTVPAELVIRDSAAPYRAR
ncbi:LacI family transcriptional regulator [Micromonospora globispora]|uniref:LacI family DNA-binding transcriptional regulator n=1 Tax=Micromonospora globispora TaxID=1450148 RepID=UPI000D6FABF3|nr:LacI family DNA-binding transcriptional regulator [Micromonospora globispora]PWU58565.1 LacI family transcriptional regulator [Micromonospora globispora]RQW87760.1 LacI family transcriptional regulator [Micromonospora globispora]